MLTYILPSQFTMFVICTVVVDSKAREAITSNGHSLAWPPSVAAGLAPLAVSQVIRQ